MKPALLLAAVAGAALAFALGGGVAAAEPKLPRVQGERVDLAKDPAALPTVLDGYRPSFRWWWPRCGISDEEIRTSLEGVKRAGFGGVEQILMGDRSAGEPLERLGYIFNNISKLVEDGCWFTPEFRDKLRFAIETAEELGLKVDITLGPGWPPSSPATHGRLAVQALAKGEADLVGGVPYSGPVPRALPGPSAGISIPSAGVQTSLDDALVSVVAVRLADPASATQLDADSAVDLTDRISGGVLNWTPPDPGARWKLFGFWQRANGGGVPDLMNPDATRGLVADYDQRIFDALDPLTKRLGGDVFEDSPEFGVGPSNIFWTGRFLSEFRKRRGYDLRRYLPVLFIPRQHIGPVGGSAVTAPEYDFPNALGMRIRRDYYETLTDLYIDHHIEPITRWAKGHGLNSRTQPAYGSSFGIVRSSVAADRADQESLYAADPGTAYGGAASHATLDLYREVTSGQHIAGANGVVGDELGAVQSGEHTLTPSQYKAFADRAVAGGITRMVVHGFDIADLANVPWPGYHAFWALFSEDWSADHPMLEGMQGLARYFAHTAAITQNGRPRMDLAVLRDDIYVYGDVARPNPLDGGSLINRGYTWDLVDSITLATHKTFATPDAMRDAAGYKALIVTSKQRGVATTGAWSADAAEHVLALARNGLPVVFLGDLPKRGVSAKDPAREDARLKAALDAILDLKTVRRAKDEKDLPAALGSLGVKADAATARDPDVLSVHRTTDSGDVYWLMNDSMKAVDVPVSFAARGYPTRIDPWDGTATPVTTYKRRRGRVTVPVQLAPGETSVLAFGPTRPSKLHVTSTDAQRSYYEDGALVFDGGTTVTLSDRRTVALAGKAGEDPVSLSKWKLSVQPVGPSPEPAIDVDLDSLTSWQDIPGLADVSGVGTYTTSFEAPASWAADGRSVRLSIGEVAGASVEVYLNGERVTWRNIPGWTVPLHGLVRAGRNDLRVVIRTTRNNKLRSVALTNADPYYAPYKTRSAHAYGLLGPVRVSAYPTTRVRLPDACSSKRKFAIHVKAPRGFRSGTARLTIDKTVKRIRVRRVKNRIRAIVDLRKRKAGTVRVRLVIDVKRGRAVHTTRIYRLCGR